MNKGHPRASDLAVRSGDPMPKKAETQDPVQLRLLSLELLKQLWARHDAMCQLVTRAASEVGGHLGNAQVETQRLPLSCDCVQASRVNLIQCTHFTDSAN